MIKKILIKTSNRKAKVAGRDILGMNGENLQEVLLFCLDEKIEGTGIVEVELPDETKGMIEVECTEEGYELPVKSSLLTQTGFVKFQLRILHDNEEIFKSEIIALEVKDSINATATIPEEYPSWVDTLTNLKKDLEKAESERVSNENERISAEKTRQENFTEMQKKSEEAVSNIKDLTDKYNENDKQKTEAFNKNFEEKQKAINDNAEAKTTAFGENAEAQTKTFNTNSDDKLAEYNRNHTAKMKEFDDNYDTKTKTFDDNASAKLDEYNKNTELKEKSFNDNAGTKTETFNTNAADKQNEFDENASDKLAEYNQNAKELINKVEQVQAENETLKAENKLIKEQIPSASASGNSIHVEDSGSLELEWKLRSEHYQKQTIQNDNLLILEDTTITTNGITLTIKDGVITINGTSTASTNIDFKIKKKLKAGTYWHMVQRSGSAPSGNVGFLVMKSGGSIASINGRGGAAFTLNEDTEAFYRIWTDKNNTISNVVYKCIISEGTDSKPWVQGIPDSPSIDYLSEVETAGSNVNEFDFKVFLEQTKNLALRRCTATLLENGFRLTKTENDCYIGENRLTSGYRVKVLPNTTYTISTSSIFPKCYINFLKNDNTFISTVTIKPNAKSQTFITTSDTEYLTFRFGYNTDAEYFDFVHIKLEKGSAATPWSPYRNG